MTILGGGSEGNFDNIRGCFLWGKSSGRIFESASGRILGEIFEENVKGIIGRILEKCSSVVIGAVSDRILWKALEGLHGIICEIKYLGRIFKGFIEGIYGWFLGRTPRRTS